MFQHLLVRLVRVFRLVDTHNLHFVELMQAVQSAHIFAIRPSLSAEACRIGTTHHGEVFLVENNIAEDVGNRHFGRGDEVKVVLFGVIHLSLFIGKLPRSITRRLVNHQWRLHFEVSAFARFFKKESL